MGAGKIFYDEMLLLSRVNYLKSYSAASMHINNVCLSQTPACNISFYLTHIHAIGPRYIVFRSIED